MNIIKFILLVALTFMTSCTPVNDKLKKWGTQEKDSLSAFLTTKDAERIVIIGDRYHYVIDNVEPELKKLALQSSRDGFWLSEIRLKMENDGHISGKVTIIYESKNIVSANTSADFLARGYTQLREGYRFVQSISVSGQAYRPSSNNLAKTNLNNTYAITLDISPTTWQRRTKLALTPVAFVSDTVISLAGFGGLMTVGIVACGVNRFSGTAGGFC